MRILKRRKGNKSYFYLQHSFRKNGIVTTKEMYLGEEIPKDIEKIKQEIVKEEKNYINENLEKIKQNFQEEWKRLPESAKEKELEQIAIAFTYNTNAIEGSTITLREVREIVEDKISPNKSLNDIKEADSHFKIFLEILNKKENISRDLILKWHGQIFSDTKTDIAGKFRNCLVRIGGYIAPDWQDVEKLIEKLIKFINQEKINPVELVARAHYRFEKIHPFVDGNGRIGRLIMNCILWHSSYPMIIIEHKKRRAYYSALKNDEEKFVQYFIRNYMKVHKKRIK
ncbi:MAG: Fic family protein [Candidatus Aenigmarchaeota archaeon]|nr:Fic family protein [Candidatus Aenigmarchaeota archaeon]